MKTYMTVFLCCIFNLVSSRDFYVGMFKRNDLLVAQDRLYKEGEPFRKIYAKYGRIFKCPITYFRIVDRLGIGRGPKVEIIRGGLRQKYLVLRLQSLYGYPISVNIYVGCENKMPIRTTARKVTSKSTTEKNGVTAHTTDPGDTSNTVTGSNSSNTDSTVLTTTVE